MEMADRVWRRGDVRAAMETMAGYISEKTGHPCAVVDDGVRNDFSYSVRAEIGSVRILISAQDTYAAMGMTVPDGHGEFVRRLVRVTPPDPLGEFVKRAVLVIQDAVAAS